MVRFWKTNRQVSRFRSPEDSIYIASRLAELFLLIRCPRHKPSDFDKELRLINRGQAVFRHEVHDKLAVGERKSALKIRESVHTVFQHGVERGVYFAQRFRAVSFD